MIHMYVCVCIYIEREESSLERYSYKKRESFPM